MDEVYYPPLFSGGFNRFPPAGDKYAGETPAIQGVCSCGKEKNPSLPGGAFKEGFGAWVGMKVMER